MTPEYFLHPESSFTYVSDSVLWNQIFTSPFPKDTKNINKGMITLSDYFEVENVKMPTPNGGTKDRKSLISKDFYFKVDEYEANTAFYALYSFLCKFSRPHRDCLIRLPNHESVEFDPTFYPLWIYFKEPQYPVLNEDHTMLRVSFESQTYSVIHNYIFGQDPLPHDNDFSLDCAFKCFCGFILQY
jgi:hypothetical protein